MATIGRPREFDVGEALDRALDVFWRKGYEGATIRELTGAMGISRPSLYAAFGDKEKLFREAMDRYAEGPGSHVAEALNAPTARGVAERLWRGAIEATTRPRQPRGCLLVQAALACGDDADRVRREAARRRAKMESLLRERFEKARDDGDLPRSVEPASLAKYVATVSHGIAVQAAGGAGKEDLCRVASLALRAIPSP